MMDKIKVHKVPGKFKIVFEDGKSRVWIDDVEQHNLTDILYHHAVRSLPELSLTFHPKYWEEPQ
jgi:hypothetical protein